jgi:type II secretory pathway pseudopilin PulG
MQKLFYYKAGLGVIGLFTLGIFIFAVVQGASAKQDTQTDKAAQSIAAKLNDYVDTNQRLPKTLAEAGVHGNTTHITYTKLSDEKYKFCVDYKTASEDYTSSVENVVGRGLYGDVSSPSGSSSSSSEDQYSLYIGSSHKKGQNCQTVAPYMYSASSDSSSTGTGSSSGSSFSCPGPGYPDSDVVSGTINTITKTDGSPLGSADDKADMLIKLETDAGGEKTFTIRGGNAFDYACTALPHNHLQEGDYATIYQQNTNPATPDAIVDYTAN